MARDYQQIEHLTTQQIEQLHELYQNEWWTRERTIEEVQRMIERCQVMVALCAPETETVVGFARVITDFVFKGLILDVIVSPDHRGKDLGRALIDAIVNHPQLRSVQHLELYCKPEMEPFYEKWGFTAELGELRFMRRPRT